MNAFALQPGRNCWRLGYAERAQIFIDAEDYFASLHENIQRAEQSIILLGWDFDSRLELVRDRADDSKIPTQLGKLLAHVAQVRPQIDIRILAWDFTTLYLPMREIFQKWKFRSLGRPQIRFVFDGQHPLGGSHHQKIVVIDNKIAYSGGLDLTSKRWDTSKHEARDKRRADPSGELYGPFHDVQVAVTGELARSLGQIARDRWLHATGERLSSDDARRPSADFHLSSPLCCVPAAISRTAPAFRGRPEIREVEALFWDEICGAQNYIYIENQYLTAPSIVNRLKLRLESPQGPQILIVLPKDQSDPVSKATMGVLTTRYIKQLQNADKYNRLFVGYPDDTSLRHGWYENVHAKVLSIDDEHLRIGSSNLNNRSMGLDTECDITLLADGDGVRQKMFRQMTVKLIANHFSCHHGIVAETWAKTPSVRELVAQLAQFGSRRLVEFEIKPTTSLLSQVADLEVFDLNHTVELETAADKLLTTGFQDEVGLFFRQIPVGAILTAVCCVLFAMRPELAFFVAIGSTGAEQALATAIGFSLTALLVFPFPVTVVLFVTLLGTKAWVFLVFGTLLAATLGYLIGWILGHRPSRLPGRWLPLVSEKLQDIGFWSVFWSRFFPFAPFAVVSLVCGRNKVRVRDYYWGTLCGIGPYLIVVYFFQNALRGWFERSDLWSLVVAILIGVSAFGGIRAIQKRFVVGHEKIGGIGGQLGSGGT